MEDTIQKKEILEIIKNITNAHKGNKFPAFIESIRFPFYKNIAKDAEIDFKFPLTVLIGANGSGKSSALHAIYGCPDRHSTGDYWFSTPLDPINRRMGEIPSIIYSYKRENDKKIVEVVKRRSGVAKGLDYWETSRPIALYGMEILEDGKRNPPIKKEVKFLDFRSELSAFDKFFHYGKFNKGKTIQSRQDFLRKYSKFIKLGFGQKQEISVYSRKSSKPKIAKEKNLKYISEILGKSYTECQIMFHNFFGEDGATVLFKQNQKFYSEAFAGRGEYAVVKLVYELTTAKEGSLIILDEPEVSLHPFAQNQLKIFLLKICLEKKLQIVISTHSPKLVEYLPKQAIKLFYEEIDGKFNIINNCSYYEAFHQIGERIDKQYKKTIIVEDRIAKQLLDKILSDLKGEYSLIFNVEHFPGGAEDLYKASVGYSQENEISKFIILDGDKTKVQYDPSKFGLKETKDVNFLEQKVKEVTGVSKLPFRLDGNKKVSDKNQKRETLIKYLEFNKRNLAYFPLNTPEEIIWDDEYAEKLLNIDELSMPVDISNYKQKIIEFSNLFYNSSTDDYILSVQSKFIMNFIKKKDDNYKKIIDILTVFLET